MGSLTPQDILNIANKQLFIRCLTEPDLGIPKRLKTRIEIIVGYKDQYWWIRFIDYYPMTIAKAEPPDRIRPPIIEFLGANAHMVEKELKELINDWNDQHDADRPMWTKPLAALAYLEKEEIPLASLHLLIHFIRFHTLWIENPRLAEDFKDIHKIFNRRLGGLIRSLTIPYRQINLLPL